jgi:hypothetical protein
VANSWHVNPETGNPGRCRVDWSNPRSTGCPHGLTESEHFSSATDAVNSYAEQRETLEDPFSTVTAAERSLSELRRPEPRSLAADEKPQYVSKEIGERSFWGRNAKKIGGAVVAVIALTTLTNLALADRTVDNADAIAPQGDASVSQEQVEENYEEPLPSIAPEDELPAESPSAEELGEQTGEKLRETGERIGEEVTPERVDKLKEAGKRAKDFVSGLLEGTGLSGFGPTSSVEVTEGVQFQGQSLQPSEQEILDAEATLATLKVTPENIDPYYDRDEQFGRSFQTGVVGNLEHRDIPSATFNNPEPQSRAVSGSFIDPYTGESVTVVKGSKVDTDVEHIVPLKEVVESEDAGRPLSQGDRVSIANDFANLQVVGSSINRSKGDRDPGEWMPPNASSHLRYAIATINVKSKYGLTVDQAERDVLSATLAARQ